MNIRKLVEEEIKKQLIENEVKKVLEEQRFLDSYKTRRDFMGEYFAGELSIDELFRESRRLGKEVVTKDELIGFIRNKFMLSIKADELGVDVEVIKKRAEKLLERV